MKIYLVGGAVRDALLGLPVQDRDWVVVGATPQALIDRGFVPVGKDFPVFLHPQTHEEYALARTERKTAPGYHGFAIHAAPDVTLQDDLARRDITINAIAASPEWIRARGQFGTKSSAESPGSESPDSGLIDPFGGQRDLANKVFRHVSPAFREDPVRILRVARFAARFADFSVAPETLALMREMVDSGEVDHLVPERVWQELARGLMEATPSRMFAVLRDCGALQRLLPEVDRLWGVAQRADYHPEIDTGIHLMMVLDMAARLQTPLVVRFACLCHDLGKGNTPADVLPRHLGHEERSAKLLKGVSERLRVPTECRDTADVVAREHSNIHRSTDFSPTALVRLLERCDALRKPQRMADILLACECDARGRLGYFDTPYPPRPRLLAVLAVMRGVDTKSIAAEAFATGASGQKVGEMIHRARVVAVQAALAN
ncbi:multifunctional CCA addition/repair protein [Rhodoferax sp. 4810]|nr:multifunctional CCA addition/repair protein [Rhodoferax jenense]